MHLPYAHSSLTKDTYKNQVHLETSGGGEGEASYLFILKVKGLTFFLCIFFSKYLQVKHKPTAEKSLLSGFYYLTDPDAPMHNDLSGF